MSEIVHATISGKGNDLIAMFEKATRGGGEEKVPNGYMMMQDGEVNIVYNLPGASVSSYSTFYAPDYLSSVKLGDGYSEEVAQSLFKVKTFLFYLDLVDDGGEITIEFRGQENADRASIAVMKSSLTAKIHLPDSDSIMQNIDKKIMGRYNGDNIYGVGDKTLDTVVRVDVSQLDKIVEVVDNDEISGIRQFPIVVEDGQLMLNVGDRKTRNSVSGPLVTESVDGPDCESTYEPGFEESISSMNGVVMLNTGPSARGAPLSLVEEGQGYTVRHAMAPTVKR